MGKTILRPKTLLFLKIMVFFLSLNIGLIISKLMTPLLNFLITSSAVVLLMFILISSVNFKGDFLIYFFLGLVILGGIFNMIALASNDFKMPVEANATGTEDMVTHFFFDDKSEVSNYFFVDRFHVKGIGIASIGDLIIFASLIFFIGLLTYHGCFLLSKVKRREKNGKKTAADNKSGRV